MVARPDPDLENRPITSQQTRASMVWHGDVILRGVLGGRGGGCWQCGAIWWRVASLLLRGDAPPSSPLVIPRRS